MNEAWLIFIYGLIDWIQRHDDGNIQNRKETHTQTNLKYKQNNLTVE
jgi:hypothetical protein